MTLLIPPAAFILAWALSWGLNQLALIPWRKSDQKHWTERARILFPARRSAAINLWFIPINCTLASHIFLTCPEPMLPVVFLAALLGTALGNYPLNHMLFPSFTFRSWLRYFTGAMLLRFGFWLVFLIAIVFMPETFNWEAVALVVAVVLFQILVNFGLWTWLASHVGLLTAPPERLTAIVKQTCERMGVKCRKVWLLKSPAGYAAALPSTKELIFSEGMLATQPDHEISAICAHELAHVSESPRTRFSRIAVQMWVAPIVFIRPVVHTFDFGGLAILLLSVSLIVICGKRLGRKMEVRADSMAKDNQSEAGVYATALERLYQTNHMPAVMRGKRRLHPHLYDRLISAGMTPDYPRPKAPAAYSWHGFVMLVVTGILMGHLGSR